MYLDSQWRRILGHFQLTSTPRGDSSIFSHARSTCLKGLNYGLLWNIVVVLLDCLAFQVRLAACRWGEWKHGQDCQALYLRSARKGW